MTESTIASRYSQPMDSSFDIWDANTLLDCLFFGRGKDCCCWIGHPAVGNLPLEGRVYSSPWCGQFLVELQNPLYRDYSPAVWWVVVGAPQTIVLETSFV